MVVAVILIDDDYQQVVKKMCEGVVTGPAPVPPTTAEVFRSIVEVTATLRSSQPSARNTTHPSMDSVNVYTFHSIYYIKEVVRIQVKYIVLVFIITFITISYQYDGDIVL